MINYVFGSAEADRAYGTDLVMATIAIMIVVVVVMEISDYRKRGKMLKDRGLRK